MSYIEEKDNKNERHNSGDTNG